TLEGEAPRQIGGIAQEVARQSTADGVLVIPDARRVEELGCVLEARRGPLPPRSDPRRTLPGLTLVLHLAIRLEEADDALHVTTGVRFEVPSHRGWGIVGH